jgi:hypothetical protein
MASREPRPLGWDDLPDEIFLQLLTCTPAKRFLCLGFRESSRLPPLADLRPYDITQLQQVSPRLQKICRDNELWKRRCFKESPWYQALEMRRSVRQAAFATNPDSPSNGDDTFPSESDADPRLSRYRRLQDMANWDPTFPGERVSWYDEYIQRNGPTSVNWFDTPRHYDLGEHTLTEARGLALYAPNAGHDPNGEILAVSPLDDGSVCLWDVRGNRGKQGGILAQSAPDILFIDGPGSGNARRSKKVDTGVTDCVSVNHFGHKAFFAVQSRASHRPLPILLLSH